MEKTSKSMIISSLVTMFLLATLLIACGENTPALLSATSTAVPVSALPLSTTPDNSDKSFDNQNSPTPAAGIKESSSNVQISLPTSSPTAVISEKPSVSSASTVAASTSVSSSIENKTPSLPTSALTATAVPEGDLSAKRIISSSNTKKVLPPQVMEQLRFGAGGGESFCGSFTPALHLENGYDNSSVNDRINIGVTGFPLGTEATITGEYEDGTRFSAKATVGEPGSPTAVCKYGTLASIDILAARPGKLSVKAISSSGLVVQNEVTIGQEAFVIAYPHPTLDRPEQRVFKIEYTNLVPGTNNPVVLYAGEKVIETYTILADQFGQYTETLILPAVDPKDVEKYPYYHLYLASRASFIWLNKRSSFVSVPFQNIPLQSSVTPQKIPTGGTFNFRFTGYKPNENVEVFMRYSGKLILNGKTCQPSGKALVRVFQADATGTVVGVLNDQSQISCLVNLSRPAETLIVQGYGQQSGTMVTAEVLISNNYNPPLLNTLTGHQDRVISLSFSPDNKLLASASFDKTVKIWDVRSGNLIKTLVGHISGVRSVQFSHDGKLLASGGNDATIKIWNVELGAEIKTLKGHTDGVGALVFNSLGSVLYSASDDKFIKKWDVATGRELQTFRGHTAEVVSLVCLQDCVSLASASYDRTIKTWDTITGQLIRNMIGHQDQINTLAVHNTPLYIISAGKDKTLRIWDILQGNETSSYQAHSDEILSSAINTRGYRYFATGGGDNDKSIKIWNGDTLVTELKGHTSGVRFLQFSPSGNILASGGRDNTIKLWKIFD
jgi:WD40 repeat protein